MGTTTVIITVTEPGFPILQPAGDSVTIRVTRASRAAALVDTIATLINLGGEALAVELRSRVNLVRRWLTIMTPDPGSAAGSGATARTPAAPGSERVAASTPPPPDPPTSGHPAQETRT